MKLIIQALRKIIHFILKHQTLGTAVKDQVKKYPALHAKLKRQFITANGSLPEKDFYHETIIGSTLLLFAKGPLQDNRGIGRVSRALYDQVKKVENELKYSSKEKVNKKIYFFSSIHWCPDVLPQRSIVMIHDVIPLLFPSKFPAAIVYEWSNRYKLIAKQASMIITISQSSATDIADHLDITPEKIKIIYNGVIKMPTAKTCSVSLPNEPFITFLGSDDHHKNIDIILQALKDPEISEIKLVIIGDKGSMVKKVEEMNLQNRVVFCGVLSDSEAGYILERSLALVFPSLYEGFGLPPLEAALLGTPSICSKRPAMTELLDGTALFADPNAPKEWVQQIIKLKIDKVFRDKLGKQAQIKASQYNWDTAGKNFALFINTLDYKE